MKRNIRREEIKEEWKAVAKIVDRFLLIIFVIAIITLTLTILYIYPTLANEAHMPKSAAEIYL